MSKVLFYKKGSVIFVEGQVVDKFYILKKGSVQLTCNDPLTKEPLSLPVAEGDFFGVKQSVIAVPQVYTATATSDVTIMELTTEEFEQLVTGNLEVAMKLLKTFSSQIKEFHKQVLENLHYRETETNLEYGLFSVAKAFFDNGEFAEATHIIEIFLQKYWASKYLDDLRRMQESAKEKLADSAGEELEEELFDAPEEETAAVAEPEPAADKRKAALDIPQSLDRFLKTFAPHEVILAQFDQGDKFYMVISGNVRVTKVLGGVNRTIALLEPGKFFGIYEIIGATGPEGNYDNIPPRSACCIATTEVKVLEFTRENFHHVISTNVHLALRLIKFFSRTESNDRRVLQNSSIKNEQIRLIDIFIMFDDMQLCATEKDNSRTYYMTAGDISQWLGLNADTVRQRLLQMQSIGQIKISDTSLIVPDIGKLRNLVAMHTKND